MPWLIVKIDVEGRAIENVVNVDTIVRFGPNVAIGSYMKFVDGGSVQLLDAYEELKAEIAKIKE